MPETTGPAPSTNQQMAANHGLPTTHQMMQTTPPSASPAEASQMSAPNLPAPAPTPTPAPAPTTPYSPPTGASIIPFPNAWPNQYLAGNSQPWATTPYLGQPGT